MSKKKKGNKHLAGKTIDGITYDEHGVPNKGMGSFGGKRNTNGFAQNPQNAGRKPSIYKTLLDGIGELGVDPPTREEYSRMVGSLMSLTLKDVTTIENHKNTPFWVVNLIRDLKNDNKRAKLMTDYRDWLFGTATKNVEKKVSKVKIDGYAIKYTDGTIEEV